MNSVSGPQSPCLPTRASIGIPCGLLASANLRAPVSRASLSARTMRSDASDAACPLVPPKVASARAACGHHRASLPNLLPSSHVAASDGMPCSRPGMRSPTFVSRCIPADASLVTSGGLLGAARSQSPTVLSRCMSVDASAMASSLATPNLVSRCIPADSSFVKPSTMPSWSGAGMLARTALLTAASPNLTSRSIPADVSCAGSDGMSSLTVGMPSSARLSRAATPMMMSRSIPADASIFGSDTYAASSGPPSRRSSGSSTTATPFTRTRCISGASSMTTTDSILFSKLGFTASAGSLSTAPGPESLSTSMNSVAASSDADEVTLEDAPSAAPNALTGASEQATLTSRFLKQMSTSGSCSIQRAPSMKRIVNAKTGDAQTIVVDENGRTSTFTQETVSSVMTGAFRAARVLPDSPRLASASLKEQRITRDEKGCIRAIDDESIGEFFDDALMRKWIASLPKCHLKGFDQELRFRLSDIWTEYSKMKAEHEDYLENADYIFFGLDKTSTLKDLERAYRKLAKLMHPDKNGGSDEAKAKFQDLKERYEKLKQKMKNRGCKEVEEKEERKELLDEGQKFGEDTVSDEQEEEESEDEDEAGEGRKAKAEEEIDRDAMEAKIWEILDTAKLMQQQISIWKEQLEKFNEQLEKFN
mmetsp:Transcript_79939/g.147099  ORF Transcript_79939/g.147099 Transcript_79939/m.147099 type:complete len:649 (-) Transcript_79939:147-2093(-)